MNRPHCYDIHSFGTGLTGVTGNEETIDTRTARWDQWAMCSDGDTVTSAWKLFVGWRQVYHIQQPDQRLASLGRGAVSGYSCLGGESCG